MTLRLLLVADDSLSASAVRRALRATASFDVIDGYVEGRGPCAGMVAAYRPDVAVIDQLGSHGDTVARIGEIRDEVPAAKIILLAARMQPGLLRDAMIAGADAAVARTFPPDGIGALVREVAAGNVFHSFAALHSDQPGVAERRHLDLTVREIEILRLAAAGSSNGRIAAQLWITEQTVKFHLSNVYRKLGVSNRTEASHYAYVHGLFETTSRGVAA